MYSTPPCGTKNLMLFKPIEYQHTEKCNTAKEQEFYELIDNIFKKCDKISYEAQFEFSWQLAESTHAQSN